MGLVILLIALLEGFTTLAVQMVSLRAAVPVVGSSIILTSIYIGIILLALSSGYYVGGIVASKYKKKTLPLILAIYLLISSIYYALITFGVHEQLLSYFLSSTNSYIGTLFITASILFFIPVFVAAQTIPLLTEMSTIDSKGKAAGSMLFWSTVGSFLGSVCTSIFLFQIVGVVRTAIIIVIMLLLCALLSIGLYNKKWIPGAIVLFGVLTACLLYIGSQRQPDGGFVYDSAYQQIIINDYKIQGEPGKVFHTNGAFASGIFTKTKESPFGYIRELVTVTQSLEPKNVLVIGTAGFTYPHEISSLESIESIDTVDIDPAVYDIATKHFLQTELSEKITFYPQSARYFINQAIQEGKTYDLIFVDAFNGKQLPDELVTAEFYASLEKISSNNHIFYNMILDSDLTSALATNILSTLQAAQGSTFVKIVSYDKNAPIVNFIVSPTKIAAEYEAVYKQGSVYTDNKRTSENDMISFLIDEVGM